MKILVTGDRAWNDLEAVANVLQQFPPGTILVHGACPYGGADEIAALIGEQLGFIVRAYPADFAGPLKKAAGPIRNQQMLNEEHLPGEPIDICFAFHNDLYGKSKGTKDMVNRALKARIPTYLIQSGKDVQQL